MENQYLNNNYPQGFYSPGAPYGFTTPPLRPMPEPKDPFINSEAKHITKLSLLAGAAALSFAGMQNIMAYLLSWTGLSSLYMSNYSFQMIFGTLCSILCIFIPFISVYGLYSKGDRENCFAFGAPVSGKAFGLAIPAGLMICIISDYISSGFTCFVSGFGIYFTDITAESPSNLQEFLLFTIECAVVPAIVEEFAIRGVIMQPLRKYGDRFALVMSSVIFALMHGNMMQIPFALIAGFALGYFAMATGSIWTSVVIHFANNFLSVLLITLNSTSAADSLAPTVLMIVISVIGVLCMIKFIKTEHNGMGLTAVPQNEKFAFIVISLVFLAVSFFTVWFEKTVAVIYIGSASAFLAFLGMYRYENRKAVKHVQVTGMPEKLLVSLYAATPTMVLAFYYLIIMTVEMVSSDGFAGKAFCIMIIAAFFVLSSSAVSTVVKSKFLENKKAYSVSTVALVLLGLFSLFFIFAL